MDTPFPGALVFFSFPSTIPITMIVSCLAWEVDILPILSCFSIQVLFLSVHLLPFFFYFFFATNMILFALLCFIWAYICGLVLIGRFRGGGSVSELLAFFLLCYGDGWLVWFFLLTLANGLKKLLYTLH